MSTITLEQTNLQVSDHSSELLMGVEDAFNKVNLIDFSPLKMKLLHENWSEESIDQAESSYKRFLVLRLVYGANIAFVPNHIIDEYWHYHILDTRKYAMDCNQLFGKFIHHDPYFGIGSEEDVVHLHEAYKVTKTLWFKNFGESMEGEADPCSSSDCTACRTD
jgi:hypothetical protein